MALKEVRYSSYTFNFALGKLTDNVEIDQGQWVVKDGTTGKVKVATASTGAYMSNVSYLPSQPKKTSTMSDPKSQNVAVWMGHGLFWTDMYADDTYTIGQALKVGAGGKLVALGESDSTLLRVAKVVTPPDSAVTNPFMLIELCS